MANINARFRRPPYVKWAANGALADAGVLVHVFDGWEEERQAEAKAEQEEEEEEAAPEVSTAAKPSTPRMLKSSLSDVVFSSLATP